MRKRWLAVGGGSVIAGGGLARRYRRDMDAARARLAAVDRTVLETSSGAVEYAERGAGEPLLAIHAIFGGCDAGLVSVDDLFPGRRVIAPVAIRLPRPGPAARRHARRSGRRVRRAAGRARDRPHRRGRLLRGRSLGPAARAAPPRPGQPPRGDLRVLARRPRGQSRAAGQPAAGALGVPHVGPADLSPARSWPGWPASPRGSR